MPGTMEALVLFLMFVVPGVVATRVLKGVVPFVFRSQIETLVVSLAISILVHLLSWPFAVEAIWVPVLTLSGASTITMLTSNQILIAVLSSAIVLFIIPVFIGFLIGKIIALQALQPVLARMGLSEVKLTPTAWDWFFSHAPGCWIIAEFADGRKVGGVYEGQSFASLSPHRRDLFLEREFSVQEDWTLGEEVLDTNGVWIDCEAVRVLRFLKAGEHYDAEIA